MAERRTKHILRADRVLPITSTQESLNLDEEIDACQDRGSRPETSSSRRSNWFVHAWRQHVSLSVPHVDCRDHLANERTALAWIRTAQAFAMLGVIIAQLMRLSHSTMPNPVLGFFVVSIPLSGLCLSMSLLILFIGFYRFIHGQKEMTRGHAVSGGWEMFVVASLSVLILIAMFVLILTISVEQAKKGID